MALRHATTAIKDDLIRPCSSGGKRRQNLKRQLKKTDKKARLSLAPRGAIDRGEESEEGAAGCGRLAAAGRVALSPCAISSTSAECNRASLSRPGSGRRHACSCQASLTAR